MFTVKQIQNTGHEEIYAAQRVSYQPKWSPPNTAGMMIPCVFVHHASGTEIIDGGTVYVMNDAGKTINRYDLGPE